MCLLQVLPQSDILNSLLKGFCLAKTQILDSQRPRTTFPVRCRSTMRSLYDSLPHNNIIKRSRDPETRSLTRGRNKSLYMHSVKGHQESPHHLRINSYVPSLDSKRAIFGQYYIPTGLHHLPHHLQSRVSSFQLAFNRYGEGIVLPLGKFQSRILRVARGVFDGVLQFDHPTIPHF